MDCMAWLKNAFGALTGNVDRSLDCVMPTFRYGERLNECDLECGTDPDTFYALDTYAQCPRAYMLKYLAKMPLSIPFYAEVMEAVRETIAEFGKGRVKRDEMSADFSKRYDELVVGRFPIHRPGKDWAADWKVQVGACFEAFSPMWEFDGWDVVDAYVPVMGDVSGHKIKGVVDLLLKNDSGEYALVVHDDGSGIYLKKDGSLTEDDSQSRTQIERLTRKGYLYGLILESRNANVKGRISRLIINLVKPKSSKVPRVLVASWTELGAEKVRAWAAEITSLIASSTARRSWPCLVPLRIAKGVLAADDDFCHERCVHCVNCRWAGMHPEEVSEYTDVTKIERMPQKYLGIGIELRADLDKGANVFEFKETATLDAGKIVKVTTVRRVLENLAVKKIGDLEGKNIDDLFNTPSCGVTKLEAMIALFYKKVYLGGKR